MPDFEDALVRTPNVAEMTFRNTRRLVRVDEPFRLPIRSFGASEVKRAALVKFRGGERENLWVDFVDAGTTGASPRRDGLVGRGTPGRRRR